MRIIDDTKLDFDDVLISPKRSQLTSRKDADSPENLYLNILNTHGPVFL